MNAIPFRIRIGVTGHRSELPPVDLLKEAIRSVIGYTEWQSQKIPKPNSIFSLFDQESAEEIRRAENTPVAFCIYSSLAEGADRIVAETVLEIEGSTLKAILPLSKVDYLKDFKTNESKTEFEKLLQQDYNPLVLRSRNLEDQYANDDIPKRRKQAYFNAGKYIVDHCDVLIAIWNGEEARGKGGTAEVIDYARETNRPVIIVSSKDPGNIIIAENFILDARAIRQIDFFNAYSMKPEREEKLVNRISKEYFPDNETFPERNSLQPELDIFLRSNLFSYYAKASTIAKKYQLHFKRSGLLAYLLSTLAIFVLVVAVVFKFLYQEAFVFEFIILFSILVIITRAHSIRVHTKWLENRFLVERLRVIPYFFISGQETSEVTVSPYGERRIESGHWLILVFSEIWNQVNQKWYARDNLSSGRPPFTKDLVNYVNTFWIGGQIKYHEGNIISKKWYLRSKKWWNGFLETGGRVIFFTAMICAVIHIIIHQSGIVSVKYIDNVLTVLVLSLPLIAAAFEGVRRQREYSRNSKRSEWMLEALKSMRKKYDTIAKNVEDDEDSEKKFYGLLKETDELMLHENQDWMMLMIQSDLEYVT